MQTAVSTQPSPGVRPDPPLSVGCLGAMILACAFFLYVAWTRPQTWPTAVAYISAILAVALFTVLYGRKQPFSRAATEFKRAEIARLQARMRRSADQLHLLTPGMFEAAVADLYNSRGFAAVQTPAVNDGGKDIIATKDGSTYFIEVKQYSPSRKVGRPEIQKLHSAVIHERATAGIFVTSSAFTGPATEYAALNQIELVSGVELSLMMADTYPTSDETPYLRAMCSKCADILEFADAHEDVRKCRNGHSVAHPMPHSIRYPVEFKCPSCDAVMVRSRLATSRYYAWRCPICRRTKSP
jgi:restriction system protein